MLEIKDENIKNENFDEMAEMIKGDDREYEKLMQELKKRGEDNTYQLFIEYYKGMYGKNFEEELRENLPKMDNEKDFNSLTKSRVNAKNIDEKESKEKLESASNDEKSFKQKLKESTYIGYYENIFTRYMAIMQEALEEQRYNRAFSISDNQGTKLVLYEKTLNDINRICKSNNIDLDGNENVKKMKDNFREEIKKSKDIVSYNNEKDIKEIGKINSRRNQIAKRIDDITISKNGGSRKDYNYELNELRKEYMQLTYRLRVQKPTLEKMELDAKSKQETEEFAYRTYGTNNTIANEFGSGVTKDEKGTTLSGESLDKTNNAMEQKIGQNDNISKQANDLLDSAKMAVKDGNFEDAMEYIKTADELYISPSKSSQEAVKQKSPDSTKTQVEKDIDEKEKQVKKDDENIKDKNQIGKKTTKNITGYTVYDECRDPKNIANEEEMKKNYFYELIEDRKNQINGIKKENEKSAQESGIQYERVRSGKRPY